MFALRLGAAVALLLTAACAPSPLYVGERSNRAAEIPRDNRGEPVWRDIPPPPAPTPSPLEPPPVLPKWEREPGPGGA